MADDDPFLWSFDRVRSELCLTESNLHSALQIKPILNLHSLEKALVENDIDGESLLALEDINVKDDLGISSFGQRREIRKIVLHLRAISPLYRTSTEKSRKRQLSSDSEQSQANPEIKKRRTTPQETSVEPPLRNTSTTTNLASRSFSQSAKAPKRRIQPQNLAAEPLTQALRSSLPSYDNDPFKLTSNTVTTPEAFDPAGLSEEWQDFLARHRQGSEDTILRPYNESDSEIELDSEEDASLVEELQSVESLSTPRLAARDIEDAIEEAIKEYKTLWNAHKRPKKYKTAHRRWMQAAKARTRKPQQNALNRELETLQDRLSKFRRCIADVSIDYHKISEVKRNCLNLQATVEDIAEKEYYLEILTSDRPPVRPEQNLPTIYPKEDLSDAEELLESSDSAEDLGDEPDDDVSDMSLISDDDSGFSLPYDPADDEWNPRLSSVEPTESKQSMGSSTGVISEPPNASGALKANDLDRPSVPNGTIDMAKSNALPFSHSTSEANSPKIPQKIEVPSPTQIWWDSPLPDQDGDYSNPDHLPESRYRDQGGTWDLAINLASSPSTSDHQIASTDEGVKTPPLNPSITPKIKIEKHTFNFPDIRELRAKKWREVNGDAELALCKVIYRSSREIARRVLQYIAPIPTKTMPETLRAGIRNIEHTPDDEIVGDGAFLDPLIVLTFYFLVYAHERGFREVWQVSEEYLDKAFEMTSTKAISFSKLVRLLLQHYIETETSSANNQLSQKIQEHTNSDAGRRSRSLSQAQANADANPRTPSPRDHYADGETESDPEPSSLKKRKRHVEQSQEALSQQRDDRLRVREQERRRQMMMDQLQSKESSGEDHRVIVNSVQEVPILLDQHIARHIKPHQESGVQFIWRELIEDEKQQGCLLAHTMGLGKTMQVISFLVTLAQCNASSQREVRELIPNNLRSGRTLILCPASLVDNWYDEIMMWTPHTNTKITGHGLLGGVYKVSGGRQFKIQTVKSWKYRSPGVLIIGYESLRSLIVSRKISDEDKLYLEKALLQDPCVVVGDEAHKMKNAKSSISKLAQKFKTNSRIALTGSPLNNHLEEYHTMIDWIAPGYLGSLVQFKAKYSEPIERGLFAESTRYEKRKSLERLYVLKRDLAPKIDRRDISAIANDMPQKTEFFITVPLTEMQKAMYRILIRHVLSGLSSAGGVVKSSNAQLWSWLAILSWLCNHPVILTKKLEARDDHSTLISPENEDVDDDGAPENIDMAKYPITALQPQFMEQYAAFDRLNDIYDANLSTRALVTQLLIQESVKKGERLLLFSHSIPTLNYLERMLGNLQYKYLRIDGSVRADQRQAATKEFNDTNNKYAVFLISTRAGGLGLNLQGANRVIIYDFGFNPSWEEQAIGRAYRLGQKKPVFVYRFRAGGSFEDVMYNKSIFKTQLFSRVVDQKNVVRQTSRNIKDYLFEPRETEQKDLSESLGKDELLDKVVEIVPGAIRDLILTETFQREDEDDELTAEEKKMADEEVEMERLQRANPQEYQAKQEERIRAQRMAAAAQTPTTQGPAQFPAQVHAGDIHDWFANAPSQNELVVRNAARANEEKMRTTPERMSGGGGSRSSPPAEDPKDKKPPGCGVQ